MIRVIIAMNHFGWFLRRRKLYQMYKILYAVQKDKTILRAYPVYINIYWVNVTR